ncbi:MAG: SPFH domain-containing protein [Phycisphaerales bacterium]|jgi:regulator of protease activity HflC (stomatin/prohibitin superfamily)|nr:SPFH domain-containing protein [Phycisphaerales bacterium]
MRVDQQAYQKAASTAGSGLILQLLIGAILLVFGLLANDTTFVFASLWVWVGTIVWVGILILYYQQKLERLEALEETELSIEDNSSMFDGAGEAIRPAARRLKLLHRWVMPITSLIVAILLVLIAYFQLQHLRLLESPDDTLRTTLDLTPLTGWALAIALAFALTGFIFSRFVAGMARIQSWTHLRGGASWMVGNTILMTAIAIGLVFRFFGNDDTLMWICWGIPIFMLAVAAEILVNFALNIYRPRIAGQVPRAAFDSKTLSLFAAPDSFVRSINEAINYQFGFDITSSWGYQLLLRSFTWLIALAVVALLLVDTMVIVEPTQQAVRLRQGALVGEVQKPGLLWKFPWPVERAIVVDVSRIRELPLTFEWKEERPVYLWSDNLDTLAISKPKPFIVTGASNKEEGTGDDVLALLSVRSVLQYRIAKDGLLQWLTFGSEEVDRRSQRTQREIGLLAIAQQTLTERLQMKTLDEIISHDRAQFTHEISEALQHTFDEYETGVEVVSLTLPFVKPASTERATFEGVSVSRQAESRLITAAEGWADNILTHSVGDSALVAPVLEAIERYNDTRNEWDALQGTNASASELQKTKKRMAEAESTALELLRKGNGATSIRIDNAHVTRWVELLDAWSRASKVRGQITAYEASPEIYRQRTYMAVLARRLPQLRKYIVGIDPNRMNVDLELQTINPLLNFSETLQVDEGANN